MTRKDPLVAPNLAGRQPSPEEQRLLDAVSQQREPKPVVSDQSLNKIQHARELGLAGADMSDPLNQMMRYGFYKDLRKDFKKGDEDRMSPREMMEMALLARILPPQEQSSGGDLEKLKAYYDQRFKEQEERIRDLVLEKRFQTLEETQAASNQSVADQLNNINQKLEALKNVPPNPTPEQKKDAITQLEEIGGQVERIKKALSPFGFMSQGQPSPGSDPYKNPDGTIDYFRFTVDKLDNTVGRVMSAWEKKAPGQKEVAETPQPQYRYRQLSPEEYLNILLSKPSRTPEEQKWLENYREHLSKQLAQLPRPAGQGQSMRTEPLSLAEQPALGQSQQEPIKCCRCGQGEIHINGLCLKCWAEREQASQQSSEKMSMLEKIKLQEEDELKRASDLASLGL